MKQGDRMKTFLVFLASSLFALVAFGQTTTTFPVEIVPVEPHEIFAFFQALSGWKGLGALGLAAIACQGLLLVFRSQFVPLSNAWKLSVVMLLSTVSGVVALQIAGVPLLEALVHSQTLAAFQVLLNQILKAWKEKA